MAAYLNAIRTAQAVLTSRARESTIQKVLQRAREQFPEYKDVSSQEVSPEELESVTGRLVDEEVSGRLAPMLTAIGEVALYGSEAAYKACGVLIVALQQDNNEEAAQALRTFIAVCRKELGMSDFSEQ